MQAFTTLTAFTTLLTMAAACGFIEDKDITGFDVANVRGCFVACDANCLANPLCVTWTWSNYNGGTCWLKSLAPGSPGAAAFVDKPGVIATTCTFNQPKVCNAFNDIDFVGMDIASKTNKQPYECCNACNEYSGCTAYAWNTDNNGTCWLKKSVGQVIAKVGVISSSLVPLYGGVCAFEYDTDFEGNDVGNKPAKDAGVCCGLCKANADCKAYSWNNFNGGTCWMKSGKGNTVKKAGVISAKLA